MRSKRRIKPLRPDDELITQTKTMELLRAIAAGEVVRGNGGDTGLLAPHIWYGQPVRLQLQYLANEELVSLPISGPPVLQPRGAQLLQRWVGGT